MLPLVINHASAHRLGFTRPAIATQLRREHWQRLARGVFQTRPLTDDESLADLLFTAKLVQCGEHAILSHRSALVEHRFDDWMKYRDQIIQIDDVEVIVPRHASCRTKRAYERPLVPVDDQIVINNRLVTNKVRTIVDLAEVLSIDELEIVLESALRGPNAWEPYVWDRLLLGQLQLRSQGSRYRSTILPGVLQRRPPDARPTGSAAETYAMQALRVAGLPTLVRQPTVRFRDHRGAVLLTTYPDFGELGRGLVIEIDGVEAHSGADALARDLKRQNQLMQTFEILRFTGTQVHRNPTEMVARVRSALARLPSDRLTGRSGILLTDDGLDVFVN